jgi:DNA polymerase-1
MNRLVIVDGNAILHRAYHALPPLTAPDGSIVNAVYGFVSILIRLYREFSPTHMAVAFDRPKPTFRKEIFEGYQSKRPKMEDDLAGQIEKVHAAVRAFGIPIYELDGFEADDVIGSLTEKAVSCQLSAISPIEEIIIVTGDRDILQLVDDSRGVKVFMPTKGISEGKVYSSSDVMERMGVPPEKIADFKALAGDSSDNYPGVAGIGPKTAIDLLKDVKHVEDIYLRLEKGLLKDISSGVQEKLKKDKENALLSKDLATIRKNAPIEFKEKDARIETLETSEAIEFLETMQFHTLLKRLLHVEEMEEPKKIEKKAEKKNTGEQQVLF